LSATPLHNVKLATLILTLLCWVLTSLAAPVLADSNHLRFKSINDKVLASIGEVRTIKQDQLGFIWIGGVNGLVRFDGYTVKAYLHDDNNPHSISSNSVNDLIFDNDGNMWIATYWGLSRYDPAQDRFTNYLHDENKLNSPSSNSVTSLALSHDGAIWFGTNGGGLNRFDPKTHTFTSYRHSPNAEQGLASDAISTLFYSSDKTLWIGTNASGVNQIQLADNGSVQTIKLYNKALSGLIQDGIVKIAEDRLGRIWIGSQIGLSRFIKESGKFDNHHGRSNKPNHFQATGIKDMHLDKHGELWIAGTDIDIYRLRINSNDFTRHRIPLGTVSAIATDKYNALWLGHLGSGVSRLDRYASAFRNYTHDKSDVNTLTHSNIYSVALGNNNTLWVGTRKGLNHLNLNTNTVKRYIDDGKSPLNKRIIVQAITSLTKQNERYLWMSNSWWGVSLLDLERDEFTHFMPDEDKTNSIKNREIWSVYSTPEGDVYAGSKYGYLNHYRPERGDFDIIEFSPNHNPNRAMAIFEDSLGGLWIGADNGLFHREAPSINQFNFYHPDSEHPIRPANIAVRTINEDMHGNIWFGTEGGGVYQWQRRHKKLVNYQVEDGLSHNSVTNIQEDDSGRMWFGTGNGLSRFDPKTKTFRNYTTEHGLPSDFFHRPASVKLANGKLAFGTTEGLSIFKPEDIFENTQAPEIVFTDFQLFNQSVTPHLTLDSANKPVLTQDINYIKQITLNHQQSVFSFSFAALNFDVAKMNQYAYQLEGFDSDWQHIGNRRNVTYTNLDPGKYVFRVKAANNEGVWNEESIAIKLAILPPWWLSWWAWVLYILAFVSLFCLVIFTFLQQKRSKDEQHLNYKLLELDKIKDDFLANTSHELRTPLNGIIGLSESLIEGACGQVNKGTSDNLKLIVNSGKRLAYLIDDILDFSKLKEHDIKLNRVSIDLHSVADNILRLTEPLTLGKPITLSNDIDKYFGTVRADENRLQQILYNLVGNAVKFTETGKISLRAYKESEKLWVEVSDTGIGIAPERIANVFEAFEQADHHEQNHGHVGGTGLGLAVTKKLVELHGGEIEIQSTVKEGTTVRFSLASSDNLLSTNSEPTNNKPASDSSVNPSPPSPSNHNAGTPFNPQAHEANSTRENSSYKRSILKPKSQTIEHHILIVDDEPINRQVLINLLSLKPYRLSQCPTGLQALDLISRLNKDDSLDQIDLILLDVMMPGISGYETCETLRKTFSVSELPIIFLTAKSQVSDLNMAYSVGANDFLNKPIVKEELFARVELHLQQANIHHRIENEVKQRTGLLKQSHEQLEHAYQHLKSTQGQLVQAEKMSSLGTLVAGVGHEINNPVSYTNIATSSAVKDLDELKSFVHDLVNQDEDSILSEFDTRFDRLFAHLSSVQDGAKRITDIVGNLRTFSRGVSSGESQTLQATSLSKGLLSTLELVKANYKHEIEFEYMPIDDPEVLCNASELNQVFMNLMINACQAMSPTDTANDTQAVQAKLSIEMRKSEDQLGIRFTDNGCGMSNTTIAKIFEPFYTTKAEGQGTGLGMAISYGIIERHSGQITVQSSLGEGTVICLYLPLNELTEASVLSESANI